jgi:MFS family permease
MLGLPKFKEDFGVWDDQLGEYTIPSSWQSAGSGAPVAGLAFGAVISGLFGNRLGRIPVLKISTVICLIGIAIQSSAISSYWQIAVGRIVTALALGLLANTVPMFLAEMAPLSIRGTMVNCYQFSIGVGAVLINTATWGMHTRTDQWAYRLSILIQAVIPIFFLVACFFLPESPRWLLSKGRSEEARRVLMMLRTGAGASAEEIDVEIQLIMAAEDDNKAQFGSSWLDCFR